VTLLNLGANLPSIIHHKKTYHKIWCTGEQKITLREIENERERMREREREGERTNFKSKE